MVSPLVEKSLPTANGFVYNVVTRPVPYQRKNRFKDPLTMQKKHNTLCISTIYEH